MNLPEPQSVTFPSLFDQIQHGTIKLPQFQRGFVWSRAQSARLLDSIIKGYPIGTFILWSTHERLRAIHNLGGLDLPDTPPGNAVKYVLDGQQRLTSLFVTLKGLKIRRNDEQEDDYSQIWLDLNAQEDEDLVLLDKKERDPSSLIQLSELFRGDFKYLASFPDAAQDRIKLYKNRIESYQFSAVQITNASIDVATEIFTRLNVGGKPLTPFEIMVAKSYDPLRSFDLAEQYNALINKLGGIEYDTIPASILLQTVSMLAVRDARRKVILRLTKDQVIDTWPKMTDGLELAIDYLRTAYCITASRLLPYPALLIPFTYFFHRHPKNPSGDRAKYLEDFFWRVALSGRYSQSVESRSLQDVERMDRMLDNERPTYDWAIDVSPQFIEQNGYFTVSRSFIKALVCLLARKKPRSFETDVPIHLDNDWLKQANSKNYHHFFPKAWLKKKGYTDRQINHIANITLVDDFLNKKVIQAKAPRDYIRQCAKENERIVRTLGTHLIGDPETWGIMSNDYDVFFRKRCQKLSKELSKLILPADVDTALVAVPATETVDEFTVEEGVDKDG